MIVIPAVDLHEGRCVRLRQGKLEDVTVYGEDPVAIARRWADLGAPMLHVVDLDGAFGGEPVQRERVVAIASAVDVPVQAGGGIRDEEAVAWYLERGVDRVVLGTAPLEDPDMLERVIRRHGAGSIVLGLDAREGRLTVRGWTEDIPLSPLEVASELAKVGVRRVVATDVGRDGMLAGPNLRAVEELVEETDLEVIASGGIATRDDLATLSETGAFGAIVGKALYEEELLPSDCGWTDEG